MSYIVKSTDSSNVYGPFEDYNTADKVSYLLDRAEGGYHQVLDLVSTVVTLARLFTLEHTTVILDMVSGAPIYNTARLQAIKALRQATGCGLLEAKNALEAWVIDAQGIRLKDENSGTFAETPVEPEWFSIIHDFTSQSGTRYLMTRGHGGACGTTGNRLTVTRTDGRTDTGCSGTFDNVSEEIDQFDGRVRFYHYKGTENDGTSVLLTTTPPQEVRKGWAQVPA